MKKLITIICIGFASIAFSQTLDRSVLATGGSYSSTANVSISFTIGEVFTVSKTNATYTVLEGFQQPYIIEDTIDPGPGPGPGSIEELNTFSIYPNPFKRTFNVKTENTNDFDFEVIDMLGKKIEVNTSIKSGYIVFNLEDYGSGIYFLKMVDKSDNSIKTFKLEKI